MAGRRGSGRSGVNLGEPRLQWTAGGGATRWLTALGRLSCFARRPSAGVHQETGLELPVSGGRAGASSRASTRHKRREHRLRHTVHEHYNCTLPARPFLHHSAHSAAVKSLLPFSALHAAGPALLRLSHQPPSAPNTPDSDTCRRPNKLARTALGTLPEEGCDPQRLSPLYIKDNGERYRPTALECAQYLTPICEELIMNNTPSHTRTRDSKVTCRAIAPLCL